MNLQQFISKYSGKYLEVAGSANAINQCTDLANGYLKEVLNLPIVEWTIAVDFPSRVNPEDFDYIKNTPEGVPEAGDLIIWGGKIGHIAIYVSGNVNWFTSFDQNWPTGSVCHLVDHSYSNVKGWLRPKGGNMSLQKQYDDCRKNRDQHWNDLQELEKVFGNQSKELIKMRADEVEMIQQLEDKTAENEKNDLARDKWYKLYKASQTNFKDCKAENQVMRTKIAMIENTAFGSASTKELINELIKRLFGWQSPISGA